MPEASPSTAGTRSVTAFFDSSDLASAARADLVAAGIPGDDITLVGSDADHFTVTDDHHKMGFWESLANFFMPDDDRRAYAEGLRRGGFALSVKADSALYDKAIDVLDRDGAVDLDERELQWQSEGWSRDASGIDKIDGATPYVPVGASTAGFGGSLAGEDGLAPVTEAQNPDVRERIMAGTASQTAPAPTGGPQSYADPASPASDRAADIVEGRPGDRDNMFGQRDLTHGRTRVRSYVVDQDR